jgi:hypothetical protein
MAPVRTPPSAAGSSNLFAIAEPFYRIDLGVDHSSLKDPRAYCQAPYPEGCSKNQDHLESHTMSDVRILVGCPANIEAVYWLAARLD